MALYTTRWNIKANKTAIAALLAKFVAFDRARFVKKIYFKLLATVGRELCKIWLIAIAPFVALLLYTL